MFQKGLQCLSTRFRTKSPLTRHLKIAENKTLNHLRIPTFEFPWPSAYSPYVKRLDEDVFQWGIKHNLMLNTQHQDRVKRACYGRMVARCYPRADYLLLRSFAYYVTWIFLVDDQLVDHVEIIVPHTIKNLTTMIDVVDYNCISNEKIYGETALLDICQRFRVQFSNEQFQRFADGIRFWGCSLALQILNEMQPQSVGLKPYETIRYYSGNSISCLSLVDIANGEMVPANIFYRPEVQKLRRCASNIISWMNDIYSCKTEMNQLGQKFSMVTIYVDQGHSLQQAIDNTAERTRKEINEFIRISQVIGLNCEKELAGYITGLQDWMRGHHDWLNYDTHRYSSTYSEEDTDD